MKFSIVIPVYNVEKYIAECIESILRQSCQDFEIILVDDGSSDCSGVICDRYAKEFPSKIRVIHNKNQGQLISRSEGIRIAKGEILWMIDSDDTIREDALEIIGDTFADKSCDMVLFNASKTNDFSKTYIGLPLVNEKVLLEEEKKELYELMVTTQNLNSLALKAVKTGIAAEATDIYQDFAGRNGEDLLQSMFLLTKAKRICYLDQNLYYYRQRQDSVVHTFRPDRYKSVKMIHTEMEKYIDLWGVPILHGRHYAREVRGWIECLVQAAVCQRRQQMKDFGCLCVEMAEDEYFRNAYRKMEPGHLSRRDAFLAGCLYRKSILCIRISCIALRTKSKVERYLKAKC